MSYVHIEDFFDFDNHEPINRIAYTEEDAKYKLKCMKIMQDLGMKIFIDNVGNICGEFPADCSSDQNMLVGSHTDSVSNGGQFDGPVGVYMALKSAENYKNSLKGKQYGNLKTIIYACEESTRFSTACIGSYYLNGKFTEEYLSTLKDKQGISFNDAVSEYKDYIFSHLAEYGIDLNNIELVDKVISPKEVSEVIETHIEQSEILSDSGNAIGIIDSIGKPVRGDITVTGPNAILTSAKIVNELTEFSKSSKSGSAEEAVRITIPKFDDYIDTIENCKPIDGNLLLVNAQGKNNHSGATPMDQRQDAVLGLSKLVLKLDDFAKGNENAEINFFGTITPKWGANQIQDEAYILMQVEPPEFNHIVKAFAEEIEENDGVSFAMLGLDKAVVTENSKTELFVDIRQQYPVTSEETKENTYNIFKNIQENYSDGKDSISFKITSQGTPVKTSTELLENLKEICDEKNYPCQIIHSWPGHDVACILDPNCTTGKRILFFIPSQGGSHNPNETTSREAIEIGTDVCSALVTQRMNKIRENYEKENVLEK